MYCARGGPRDPSERSFASGFKFQIHTTYFVPEISFLLEGAIIKPAWHRPRHAAANSREHIQSRGSQTATATSNWCQAALMQAVVENNLLVSSSCDGATLDAGIEGAQGPARRLQGALMMSFWKPKREAWWQGGGGRPDILKSPIIT